MKKALSLFIALCLAVFSATPAAFAEGGTKTMEIVVNAGECVSVWNTDISANVITSNRISVLITPGTVYDAVFPETADTAAALSKYSVGIDAWETSCYIRSDTDNAYGMLVRLGVTSGKALLRIESTGTGLSEKPLTVYRDPDTPLIYFSLNKGESAEYILPEKSNISNITLVMYGRSLTKLKRTINKETDSYEIYKFAQDDLVASSYEDGKKTASRRERYMFSVPVDGKIYNSATLILPCGVLQKNTGAINALENDAVIAVPNIGAMPGIQPAEWATGAAFGIFETPEAYTPIFGRNVDSASGALLALQAQESNISYAEIMLAGGGCIYTAEIGEAWGKHKLQVDWTVTLDPDNDNGDVSDKLIRENKTFEYESNDTIYFGSVGEENNLNGRGENTIEVSGGGEAAVIPVLGGNTDVAGFKAGSDDTYMGIDFYFGNRHNVFVSGGTADKSSVKNGETVTVTADVPQGMKFTEWKSDPELAFDKGSPTAAVEASGGSGNIYIYAEFEPLKYAIAADPAGTGGSVTPDKAEAAEGETVTVSVVPDAGYAVSSVSGYGGDSFALVPSETEPGVYTFTMPGHSVTLSAAFEKIGYSVSAGAEHGMLAADRQTAHKGDTVTLTLMPQSDYYHLGSLTVRSGGQNVETVKDSDSAYTFTMPAGDVTASAIFAENSFVYFVDWNGEVLGWGDYLPDETPVYTGATPAREQDERCTYAYSGWDRQIVPVSAGDRFVTYTATYTAAPREYSVTFSGADGTVLQSGSLHYGETPVYSGATPVKAADESFVYTFAGWEPEIASVTGNAAYTPVFSAVPVLHEGRNAVALQKNVQTVCPFTPEKSGYYRFRTSGDAVQPRCSLTDGAGDGVGLQYLNYDTDRDMHFEFIAMLEAGNTYSMALYTYNATGRITLSIQNVDMHTVHLDRDVEHGTVGNGFESSFMAYEGQIIAPYATPDRGYGFLEMTVTDESGKRLMGDNGRYTMPGSDVYVTATFAPAYPIVCDMTEYVVACDAGEAVFLDWTSGDAEQRAAGGAGVEFTFYWDEGYVLDKLSVKTAGGEDVPFGTLGRYLNRIDIWFDMPSEPVTVTVYAAESSTVAFAPSSIGGITRTLAVKNGLDIAAPGCPFAAPRDKAFVGWSTAEDGDAEYVKGDTITVNGDITLFAVWEPKPFTETAVLGTAGGAELSVALGNITGSVTLLAAAYKDGKLASAEKRETASSSETFTLTGSYDSAKVFVFDCLEGLTPLTDAEEITLK